MSTLTDLDLAVLPRTTSPNSSAAPVLSGPELTIDMVNFLLVRPSFDDIAQHLCAVLFAHYQPWSATIFTCSDRGFARILGDFGSGPNAADSIAGFDCTTHSPVARALFQGVAVANFDEPKYAGELALSGLDWFAQGPAVLHPLSAPSRFLGAVHMRFLEVPDSNSLVKDLACIAPPIALHLASAATAHEAHQGQNGSTHHLPIPEELNARQLQVLTLMSEHKTNAQIARIIGFSESTVRQETMAIFRFLGVHDRREAVKVATTRGILVQAD
jgi:DNA-binding CsgD family transcriptional regulator